MNGHVKASASDAAIAETLGGITVLPPDKGYEEPRTFDDDHRLRDLGAGPKQAQAKPERPTGSLDMTKAHDRLVFVRMKYYKTASDAAKALDTAQPTYLSHENGTRGLKRGRAEVYAQHFGVSTGWLLTGQGPMERPGGSAPPTAIPGRASFPSESVNPLVRHFQVSRDADNRWSCRERLVSMGDESDFDPIPLPDVDDSRGYLAVLNGGEDPLRHYGKRSRPVEVNGEDDVFYLVDFIRLDVDLGDAHYCFGFRPKMDGLLTTSDLAIVDIEQRKLRDGLYLLNNSGKLVTCAVQSELLAKPNSDGEIEFQFWSRSGPPESKVTQSRLADFIVGRIVTVVRTTANPCAANFGCVA